MKCRELWGRYLDHLSVNAAYDFILSCKVCLPLIVLVCSVVFYIKYLPEMGVTSTVSRGFFSVILGVGMSVFTMPLLIIGIVAVGMLIRFVRDVKNGTCFLCTWFKSKRDISS